MRWNASTFLETGELAASLRLACLPPRTNKSREKGPFGLPASPDNVILSEGLFL